MSLDHILLGALEEPRSGYDLKRWFDEVFAFFWNADQSQIYRTLGRLSEQGLLSVRAAASPIGPDKRVYRTTAKGRAEVKRWLKKGPVSPAQRSAIYAQLIFLSLLKDEDAADFLATMKAQADHLVAALERVPDDDAPPETEDERRVAFFNRASLALGLARARATQSAAAAILEAHRAQFVTEDRHGHAA
ncbi:MAG: helix-turn-helix transcriptional regulator [Hyphomonadaceae bacterium]|nr:helix-turn-helix transcriptional regulator [Hyphomonadaceae bacterium]